jgi:hypothetical protein
VLVLGGGGFAAWHYLLKDHSPLAAERRYLPAGLSSIAIYQYDAFRSSPAYAEIRKCPTFKSQLSFAVTPGGKELDIVRAVILSQPYQLAILTMRNSVTIKELIDDSEQATESKHNGKTIYTVGERGYFIDGKQVLVAKPAWIEHTLDLPSASAIPESLQKAITQADLTKPQVQIQTYDQDNRAMSQGQTFPGPLGDPPQAMLIEVEYQNPIVFQMKFVCKDAAAANKMAEGFRGPAGQNTFGLVSNVTVDVKDATVIMRATMNLSNICGSILK